MAAIPITVQLIDAFGGSGQGIHSIILPDIFSSGGSFNVWMDKYARVRRILGYTAQGAAVTTNTGGSATRIRNYFPYRKTSGGAFTRQLIGLFDDAVNEFEFFFSNDEGVSWTFVQDFGAGSINTICDFAQFGDELYVTNGVVAPKVWNGAALTTAGSTQLAAPTIGSLTTGNLSGSFKWKIVPRKTDGTRKQGSVASAATSLESNAVTVTWVADADVTVQGYEIYRTTGTGEIFYFVDYVDGIATVSYADNKEDIIILENRVMEEHGDAPPIAYFCVSHKQRMWWLRTDANPQRGHYSDPGTPQSVYSENFVEFQDAETQGDLITGAVGNFEGMLVVFEERSVWTVSGTGQIIGNIIDFDRTRTNAQTGAVSDRAIIRVPAGARYVDQTGKVQTTTTVALAYMTPLKDVRLFDGDNDLIISHPLSELCATLNYQQRRKVHTLHDTTRSEIAWIFPAGSESEPSVAAVWNYRWGIWYERDWTFSAAVEVESATEAAVCIGGSSSLTDGGISYRLWNGNTANGVSFTAQWMTKTLYAANQAGQPIPSYQKRWRWTDILFKVDQDVQISVEWLQGDAPDNADSVGSVTITPGTDTLFSSDGEQIETFDGDAINVALDTAQKRAKFADIRGKYLHDYGMRLRIGDSISTGSWAMEALTLGYQILPGLARRRSAALNP
jgi:hypothetical protein